MKTKFQMGKLFLSGVLALFLAYGAPEALAKKKGPGRAIASDSKKPLLKPTIVKSALATSDAAVAGHYVSHSVGAGSSDPRMHDGADLMKVELQAILDFIKTPAPDGTIRRIYANRYEVGDEKIINALIEAKRAGIEVYITTDWNVALNGKFKEGEKHNADFASAEYNESAMAEGRKKLLEAGFVDASPKVDAKKTKWIMYSQPLYNKQGSDMETPIMHRKDLIFVTQSGDGKLEQKLYTSTFNWTDNPRFNRMIEITEPNIVAYFILQTHAMMEAFEQGLEIKGIKTPAPLRVVFKDGTFVETAFTDGKYNPNDRIGVGVKAKFGQPAPALPKVYESDAEGQPSGLLNRAAAEPGEVKLKGFYYNHFVQTHSGQIYALRAAMEKQTDFKVTAVFDDKFAGTVHGYGLGPAIGGYNIDRQMGGPVQGFPSALTKGRTELYVYQSDIPGRVITDPDGPPTGVELDHDKTTVVDSEKSRDVFTGSLNDSNHIANAEVQLWFNLAPDSPFGKSVVDSIEGIIKNEPEKAVPMDLAIFRGDVLAKVTGHSWPEIPLDKAAEIKKAFETGDFDAALSGMRELAEKPTALSHKLSHEQVLENIGKLAEFTKWYATNMESAKKYRGISSKKLVYAATAITHASNAWSVKAGLGDAVWESGADVDARVAALWKLFGIKEPIPTPKAKPDEGPEPSGKGEGGEGIAAIDLGAREGAGKRGSEGSRGKTPGEHPDRTSRIEHGIATADACEPPLREPGFRAPRNQH